MSIHKALSIDYTHSKCECCYTRFNPIIRGLNPTIHHIIPQSFQKAHNVNVQRFAVLCRKCHNLFHLIGNQVNVERSIQQKKFIHPLYINVMRNATIANHDKCAANFSFIARGIFSELKFSNSILNDCIVFHEKLYRAWIEFERERLDNKSVKYEKHYPYFIPTDNRLYGYLNIFEYPSPS